MSIDAGAMKGSDAVLVAFDQKADIADHLTRAAMQITARSRAPIGAVQVCRDLASPRVWVYFDLAASLPDLGDIAPLARERLGPLALGQVNPIYLSGARAFCGASPQAQPDFRYIVWTDVDLGGEEDLERWYDQEHMPGLAAVPGVVRARRFVALGAAPRYFACYDMATPKALETEAWLAVRGTAWSSRVRPTFRNTRRVMARRLIAWTNEGGLSTSATGGP